MPGIRFLWSSSAARTTIIPVSSTLGLMSVTLARCTSSGYESVVTCTVAYLVATLGSPPAMEDFLCYNRCIDKLKRVKNGIKYSNFVLVICVS